MSIDTILVKVSSRCNIDCEYCYVYNMGDNGWKKQPPIISPDIVDALKKQLLAVVQSQKEKFALILHGGEPLMLGERKLSEILGTLRDVLPIDYPIGIQSNGMLITKEIIEELSKYKVGVSISLDGNEYFNDLFRFDKKRNGTYAKVVAGIECVKKTDPSVFSGILAVVNPFSNPSDIYYHLKMISPESIDFLYRDGNIDKLPFGKNGLYSTEYGQWMCRLIDIYLTDKNPPRIRVIDDLFKLSMGGRPQKEGLGSNDFSIVIIDTDGSIKKNDTLKSSYDGADFFEKSWNIKTDQLVEVVQTDDFKSHAQKQLKICQQCSECQYFSICGAGMPLHRYSKENGYQNPSVYCEDQKMLIQKIANILGK